MAGRAGAGLAEVAGVGDGALVFRGAAAGPAFAGWADGFFEPGEDEKGVFEAAGALDGFEESGAEGELGVALGFGSRDEVDDGAVGIAGGLLDELLGGCEKGFGTFELLGGKGGFDGFLDLAGEVEVVADFVGEEGTDDLELGEVCVGAVFQGMVGDVGKSRDKHAPTVGFLEEFGGV